ncbi:MAG: type II and III secretion system protein family protein [Rhodomicrobium sp.]|nr:type II and III secretion system protein family protein [Rhodomicrobium sp.]
MRSAQPIRVAGVTNPDASSLSLTAATPASLADGNAVRRDKKPPTEGPRIAEISDLAEASPKPDGVKIVPEKEPSDQSYLPERDRNAVRNMGTEIFVPVSQGRLLRFDEPVESVFIADPSVADIRVVAPDIVYVYGKAAGRTNLLAVSDRPADGNAGPKLTGSALLRVEIDAGPVVSAKEKLSPNAPADISIFGKRTVIDGRFKTIDQAVDVANVAQTYTPKDQPPINSATLDGSNQINIRVRFAEVSRQDLKTFGIDWNVAVTAGSFSFGLQRTGATSEPNLGLGASFGNFDIDLLIEALQANGALTVLAEPNLTAVTGESASFLAGGEVPIPVPTSRAEDLNSAVSIVYKPFGVSLSFTPTLVKQNRIALRVKPEVSSITATTDFSVQGFNLPTFSVRRAETVVEVASGQTFALAGLFQREISRNVDKLPVLGDVPVLGPLFRSERYQRNETELVILITPYLVRPVSDRSLATPLDRMEPAPSWQADVVGAADPTGKGAVLTGIEAEKASGFILNDTSRGGHRGSIQHPNPVCGAHRRSSAYRLL